MLPFKRKKRNNITMTIELYGLVYRLKNILEEKEAKRKQEKLKNTKKSVRPRLRRRWL